MLDIDLSNPINKVRSIIGDWDSEWVSDDVIQHFLDENNNNIVLAAYDTISAIVNRAAYYVREESGDVEVYWQDLYPKLLDIKNRLEKDTLYSRAKTLFYFGGTDKYEVERVKRDQRRATTTITDTDFERLFKRVHSDLCDPYRFCYRS